MSLKVLWVNVTHHTSLHGSLSRTEFIHENCENMHPQTLFYERYPGYVWFGLVYLYMKYGKIEHVQLSILFTLDIDVF